MRYVFNWERTISENTRREFEPELRHLLNRGLSEIRDEQEVSVKLFRPPDDPFDEEIIGEVSCGATILGQVRGTIQQLKWCRRQEADR